MSADTFYLQKELNKQRIVLKQYELRESMSSSLSIKSQIPSLLNVATSLTGSKKKDSSQSSTESKTWVSKTVLLLDSFQRAMRLGKQLQKVFQKND